MSLLCAGRSGRVRVNHECVQNRTERLKKGQLVMISMEVQGQTYQIIREVIRIGNEDPKTQRRPFYVYQLSMRLSPRDPQGYVDWIIEKQALRTHEKENRKNLKNAWGLCDWAGPLDDVVLFVTQVLSLNPHAPGEEMDPVKIRGVLSRHSFLRKHLNSVKRRVVFFLLDRQQDELKTIATKWANSHVSTFFKEFREFLYIKWGTGAFTIIGDLGWVQGGLMVVRLMKQVNWTWLDRCLCCCTRKPAADAGAGIAPAVGSPGFGSPTLTSPRGVRSVKAREKRMSMMPGEILRWDPRGGSLGPIPGSPATAVGSPDGAKAAAVDAGGSGDAPSSIPSSAKLAFRSYGNDRVTMLRERNVKRDDSTADAGAFGSRRAVVSRNPMHMSFGESFRRSAQAVVVSMTSGRGNSVRRLMSRNSSGFEDGNMVASIHKVHRTLMRRM